MMLHQGGSKSEGQFIARTAIIRVAVLDSVTSDPNVVSNTTLETALGLRTFRPNIDAIMRCVKGRVVLVTGAGGSIGSELCCKIAFYEPALIIGLDQAESPLFEIEQLLKHRFPKLNFRPCLANIQKKHVLARVFSTFSPQAVYHAAAYKHVPMLEENVTAAVENNVLGTANVVEMAVTHACERFALISTDKAVEPVSVLGATKRLAELVCLARAETTTATRINVVRFGNVLNSNGSVTSIFRRQIAEGGPLTITHPQMRRYFLSGSTATDFVLEASAGDETGQVFEMDLGQSISILDLARKMIELYGRSPDVEIAIHYSGLRPGEKLHEAVGDWVEATPDTPIRRCNSVTLNRDQMRQILDRMETLVEIQDETNLLRRLREVVPGYRQELATIT
ncbi:MAG: polysaccharide biosynthesis protein [Bdellovibrionia bacterium]